MSAALVLGTWAATECGSGGDGLVASAAIGGHWRQAVFLAIIKSQRLHCNETEQKGREIMADTYCLKRTTHSASITNTLDIWKSPWKECKQGSMSHKIKDIWFYYYSVNLLLLQGNRSPMERGHKSKRK